MQLILNVVPSYCAHKISENIKPYDSFKFQVSNKIAKFLQNKKNKEKNLFESYFDKDQSQ